MTDMESKLRQAGVAVDRSRLATATFDMLSATNGNVQLVVRKLFSLVVGDVRLLAELIGDTEIRAKVEAYVLDRAHDMAGRGSQRWIDGHTKLDPAPAATLGGASRDTLASHTAHDRPPTILPDASQTVTAGLGVIDRSGNPIPGEESQSRSASQHSGDLPTGNPSRERGASHSAHESLTAINRPASVNPLRKAAAAAVARAAADYQIPGVPGRRLGSITRHDRMNLSINSAYIRAVDAAISKREEAGQIRWTDMNTPLERLVSPAILREIRDEIEQAKEQAIQSARMLTHGNA